MPRTADLRRHIGDNLEVDWSGGGHAVGRLLNVGRRSLWLVTGEEDHFVPLDRITAWHSLRAS